MVEQERRRSELDFWGGHSLKDSCEWVELPGGLFLYDFHRIAYEFGEIKKLDYYLDLFERLEEYLDTNQGEPVKILAPGDVVNLASYPKGTIVRFGIDIDKPVRFRRREFKQLEENWGIITQTNFAGRYYDLLIGWSFDEGEEVNLYNPEHMYTNFRLEEITVGETIHSRLIEPTIDYLSRLLGLNKWQYLLRFNWVEIWKFGTEVRQREKEPQRIPSRVLNAKPVLQ